MPTGGGGGARAVIPGASASTPKQGAYGKVKIHAESKLSQLSHLDEVWEMLRFKAGWSDAAKTRPLPADASPSRVFCEEMLVKVSRSFALVIQQLPDHLRASICVFYLVLRGLDTVEDDMVAFAGRQEEKLHHLRAFHTYLSDPGFGIEGVGEGDEATLLVHFAHVNAVFATLLPVEREVIADICARMGEGMASFAGRDLREGTLDVADYNLYCHYVAGLVGEGLSRLFVAHGDEDVEVAHDVKLADDMGLFLQKTNIIRDYLEDLVEGRAFWPRQIWSAYSPGLANLRSKVDALVQRGPDAPVDPDAAAQEDTARACLNHMVADALTLAPSCLRYMQRLRSAPVFRFCAIPQLMAIATLAKLANNRDVFTGVVKLRKGLALKLLTRSVGMADMYEAFLTQARAVRDAIPRHHKVAHELAAAATAEVEAICLANMPPSMSARAVAPFFSTYAVVTVLAIFVALVRFLYLRSRAGVWGHGGPAYLPRITDSLDVAALAGAVACVAYILACAGIPVVMGLTVPPAPVSAPAATAGKGGDAGVGVEGSAQGDAAAVAAARRRVAARRRE